MKGFIKKLLREGLDSNIKLYHKIGGKQVIDIENRISNVIKNGLIPYDPFSKDTKYGEKGEVIWFSSDYNDFSTKDDANFVVSIINNEKNKNKYGINFDGKYYTANKQIPFNELEVIKIPVGRIGDKIITNDSIKKFNLTPEKINNLPQKNITIYSDIFNTYSQPYINIDNFINHLDTNKINLINLI